MISRREFGFLSTALSTGLTAFAQHAAVQGDVPPDTVWLNANENPDGPPEEAREAITRAIAEAGRYSHRVFPLLNDSLAHAVGLTPEQIIPGTGSTEILHCAIDAFTSPDHPLVTSWPTWEMTRDLAEAGGRRVIKVPLTDAWSADVERIAEEASRSGAGVVHLGNPNNPTSSITPKTKLAWLVEHLPPSAILLVDEAYIQFADSPEAESCIRYVKEGRNVIVTRTFSKLYGMAGVRVGFGCAPPDLVRRMQPFRNNVISVLGARAAMAAISLGDRFVADRRARRNAVRTRVCAWLRTEGFRFIDPHANFVLIHVGNDVGKDVAELIPQMLAHGVAVGRRFEAVNQWMRVAIGTDAEMAKFQRAFLAVNRPE
jgi:histidinol-phosphate aminotransferase